MDVYMVLLISFLCLLICTLIPKKQNAWLGAAQIILAGAIFALVFFIGLMAGA